MVEEVLKVLRTNKQITEQQYQELLGKAHAAESSQASPSTPARPKVGYKPGRGFQFGSVDGKHTLTIGGRVLTRWGYTDRDGDATGQSDESEFRIAAARLWWMMHLLGYPAQVLDGGWQAWLALQAALESGPASPPGLRLCRRIMRS